MPERSAKDLALEAIRRLPPDATVDEIFERLFFLAKLEDALAQANAGDTVPHEQVRERFKR